MGLAMRITIEATDDVADLTRARDFIEAMLTPLATRPVAFDPGAHIDTLALSRRSYNALVTGNVLTVGDLCRHTRAELMRIPSFGLKSFREIIEVLEARGLQLADSEDGGDDE